MHGSAQAASLEEHHEGATAVDAATRLAYATPVPTGSPVAAGAAVLFGGLGLVLLGGCFLIGVLVSTEVARENTVQGAPGLTPWVVALLCVLYFATFACFLGALILLVKGTRALMRVMRS